MPWRFVLILGIVAALLGMSFGAGWKVNGDRWEAKYTKAELRHSQELNFQAEAAISASNAYRTKEQEWEQQRAQAEAKHAQEIRDLQKRISALAAASSGLRDDLRQAAAECGAATDDPITACRHYAAALGNLLVEFRGAGLQVAEAAETHASDVRRLLDSWPQ
jgi:hypothetical protein